MKKIRFLVFPVLAGACLVMGGIPSVYAQEDESFTLEEITVTAEKREENLQKVAIPVEAVSGDDLRELGKINLDEALSTVSSTFLTKTSDGWQVSARGISNDLPAGESSPQSVSVNKDGVYTYRKDAGLTGFYDIERVEVLLGPQSTLYSSNTPGGVVNIITVSPKIDKYEASGTLEIGSFELLHTEGMVNIPAGEKLAIRAAFSTQIHDGYLSNGQDDEDTKSARLKLLYEPNDDISILVTGEHTALGGKGFGTVAPFGDEDDVPDPWYTDNSGDTIRETTTDKIYAKFEWDMGFANLTFMPAYTDNDQYTESTSAMFEDEIQADGGWNDETVFEARLSSPADSNILWIIGLYWHETDWFSESRGDRTPGTGDYETMTHWMKSQAAFGNITYPFTDQFRVTVGARITKEEFEAHQTMETPPVFPGGFTPLFDWVWEDTNPDYKVGFEYDLSESAMLYASFTTSIRSDARGNSTEKLNAIQVGSKNRFLKNRLQLNGSAFYYDYKDYIAIDRRSDPDYPGVEQTPGPTQGDCFLYGLDVSMSYLLTQADRLNVSFSYLHSEFTDLLFDYYTLADVDYEGEPLTHSPDLTVTASYNHDFYLPNGGTISGRIDTRYMTESYVNFTTQDPDARVEPAHTLSNLSVIYRSPDDKYSITGYVKNIEDHAEKRRLENEEIGIGPPRTYGAILSVTF